VCGSGCIDPRILDLGTSCRWSDSRLGCFTSGEKASRTNWIGGWVGPSTGLDVVERGKTHNPVRTRTLAPQLSRQKSVAIPTAPSRLQLDTGRRACCRYNNGLRDQHEVGNYELPKKILKYHPTGRLLTELMTRRWVRLSLNGLAS
jgi:hypothetical protein